MKKLLSLIVSAVMVCSLSAQTTTSSMNGKVTDEKGEALVGATVIAVHTPSGTQYGAITNADGRYNLQGMRTGGPYSLTVSYVGYQSVELTGITLSLGEPRTFDVQLKETQELDAVVVVSTANSRFNANKTGAASNFTRGVIENLPSIDRSISDIARLSPLASSTKSSTGGISFAGTNNRYNSFQIDGAVSNDVFGLTASGTNGGQTGTNPISMETIEEVQVVIAPYDVRQSGFTGGGINAVTKSGNNAFRGSAYTYYKDNNLVGKGAKGEKYAEQTTQTYGVTLGGPIVKDKLFFFVSGEYYKDETPATVYDSNNIEGFATQEQLTQIREQYKALTGYDAADFGQHTPETWSANVLARLDWNINNNNKMMLRYNYGGASLDRYSTSNSSYTFNDASFDQRNETHSLVFELQSRFSNSVSNELRAGWTRVRDWREAAAPDGAPNVSVTVNNAYGDNKNRKTTVYLGTEYCSYANQLDQDIFTLTDNLTWYKGNHTVTFGTHNEFYRMYNVYAQNATGGWAFNSIEDFMNNDANTFRYTYYENDDLDEKGNWGAKFGAAQLGFYLQDEWRANDKFTWTYGLRLDIPVMFKKPSVNKEFNESEQAQKYGVATGDIASGRVLLSPRMGFRWYADEDHNILLRGGLGLFTGRVPFVWMSNQYSNSGVDQVSVTAYRPSDPKQENKVPALGSQIDAESVKAMGFKASSATINVVDKKFKYPQVFRINAAADFNLGNGWQATLEALYSKTFNNMYVQNIDYEDSGLKFYAAGSNIANAANTNIVYKNTTSYSDIIYLKNTNKGYSYSLTAQLRKSFSFGLTLDAAYTFGHSYSVYDGTSSVALSNWKYNYARETNNPELAVSSFDVPHRIIASANYNVRYGKKSRWGTNLALIYEGHSGQAYSLYYFFDKSLPHGSQSINGDGYNGNDLLYIPNTVEVANMNWKSEADKNNFEHFILGDKYLRNNRGKWSERNKLRMPFESQFDFSLSQDFIYNLKRGGKITLMWTVMNVVNLLNKDWGKYYRNVYAFAPLTVTGVTEVKKTVNGEEKVVGYDPTYSYYENTKSLDDYFSRWRMQFGVRITF
ncbi:TonB-dependent receptor [Alistipes sp. Z76]|nr:TonB-dependent receptor [Alistipes sp. Z76]NCE68211.1 TonB-dependent receptor [Muribaculaceae bacterium M3]